MSEVQECHCQSGKPFAECCEPYIQGTASAPTAEALMRSRYTAYVLEDIPYLTRTLHPKEREDFDEAGAVKWAREADWQGLEIVRTEKGGADDSKGEVEFIVNYKRHGSPCTHHELAEFRKSDDVWYFYDGKMISHGPTRRTEPKIGRNEPCPCGSGKKYKKCCMNA
jgi:SEC-C motif-containing protein